MSELGEASTSLFYFPSTGLSHSYLLLLRLRNTTEQQQRTHQCLWCVWGCVFPHMASSELYFTVLQSLCLSPAASEAGPTHSVGFHLFYPPLQVFCIPVKGKTHNVYFTTSIFEKHSGFSTFRRAAGKACDLGFDLRSEQKRAGVSLNLEHGSESVFLSFKPSQ